MNEISTIKLANGMRIVTRQSSSDVDYCGVVIHAGSRNESTNNYGLAHFVEHTIFKGTTHRRAYHILNRMEVVGGELNAYTTKEETVIYSIFPHGHFNRAAELIADLVINSQFPSPEIEREREVVASEIDSYLDIPTEAIYDDFEELIFAGTPLAHNILGNLESLNSFTSHSAKHFIDRFYTPERIVFFYYGSLKPHVVAKAVERFFAGIDSRVNHNYPLEEVSFTTDTKPVLNRRIIDTHQAHTIIGTTLPGHHDKRRYATLLLMNILGGPGMNSLLNIALREKRGLVYTVEASTTLFPDIGVAQIYFGCDHDDINRCQRLILNQIQRLIDTPLSQRQLDSARRQFLGQLTVSSDNAAELAISTGRAVLYFDRVSTAEEIAEKYFNLTPNDIQEAATLLDHRRLSSLSFV